MPSVAWGDDFSHDYFASRYRRGTTFGGPPSIVGGLLEGTGAWWDPTNALPINSVRAVVAMEVHGVTNDGTQTQAYVGLGADGAPWPGVTSELGITAGFSTNPGGGVPNDGSHMQVWLQAYDSASGLNWSAVWAPELTPATPFAMAFTINADATMQLEFANAAGPPQIYTPDTPGASIFGTPPTVRQLNTMAEQGVFPLGAIQSDHTFGVLSSWSYEIDTVLLSTIAAGPGTGGTIKARHRALGASMPGPALRQYTIADLVRLARAVGFGANAAMAAAIAMAESGGDPHNSSVNAGPPVSVDRGLWQINSVFHNEVSDSCAYDPVCCARAALRISGDGHDWSPWSTFTNGAYLQYLGEAEAVP